MVSHCCVQGGADGQCPELSQSCCGRPSRLLAVERPAFPEEEGSEEGQRKPEWSDAGNPLPCLRTSGPPGRCVNIVAYQQKYYAKGVITLMYF